MSAAARRVLWCVVLLTWPAVIGVKTAWHPSWGGLLSDAGAAFTVALGTVLLRCPQGVARLAERRTRRQLAELAARQAALAAEVAEMRALRASGIEGVRRALTSAGIEPPECVTADAPTQPIYLRAV